MVVKGKPFDLKSKPGYKKAASRVRRINKTINKFSPDTWREKEPSKLSDWKVHRIIFD